MTKRRGNFFNYLVVVAGFVLVGLISFHSSALAARESLSVSPTKAEFKLTPGQQIGSSIKIKNSGDVAMNVEIVTELFTVKNEYYDQEFKQSDNHLAANNWFDFAQGSYYLEPKQEKTVNYNVAVPKDAEPGGHYVAIITQTKSNGVASAGVFEIRRIASLMYFQISGDITKTGSIESLETDYWQKASPINTKLMLRNSGNTHYRADGVIILKNIFNKEIKRTSFDVLLLPNTSRLFESRLEGLKFPGFYKLETNIVFPQGGKAVKMANMLYLPPVHIYILGAIVIICGVLIYIYRRRLYKKKA